MDFKEVVMEQMVQVVRKGIVQVMEQMMIQVMEQMIEIEQIMIQVINHHNLPVME